jgi:polygalacturonase
MWSVHPTNTDNVLIRNLAIHSTSGDGIDVDSCRHVRIEGCDISTSDDCIAIKSGRGMEGYTPHAIYIKSRSGRIVSAPEL